jgi:hypothetical protein
MSGILSLGTALLAASLFSAQVNDQINDNGTTGEWRIHSGSPVAVHEMEVEIDPSDAVIAGVLPNTGWVSALGFEMRGRHSTFDFATSTAVGSMWCLTGSEDRFADIRLHVPHNARITFFRMWGFDGSNDHDLTSFLFESCLPSLSAGSPTNTQLAQLQSSGNPGSFTETTSLPSPEPVTDTRNCTYWARARFANDCQNGGVLILRKFRIQYTLAP